MKHALVSLFAATVLTVAPSARSQTTGEPKVGDVPPTLGLAKLLQAPEGRKVNWAELKGKVVVLEFWATWCAPCVAAIPHLNELADRFKDRPVQFIAVTDEDEKVITAFLKRKPIHAWVGLDSDKSMFKDYRITGIPHTVVVDRKGKIAAITYPTSVTEAVLGDVLAGKKLALAQATGDHGGGIRPGEVPYGGDQGQPSLFQVLIRRSAADEQNGMGMASGNGSITVSRSTVLSVLSACYGINPTRIVTNSALPEGNFDFVVKTPAKSSDAATAWLRQAVETTFGLSARRETREVDVFVLSAPKPNDAHLTPTVSTGGSSFSSRPGTMEGVNQSISSMAWSLEGKLGKPILDETGLTNRYDFDLKWNEANEGQAATQAILQAVREQLGFELAAAKRPVEMLVVEKSTAPDGDSRGSPPPAE